MAGKYASIEIDCAIDALQRYNREQKHLHSWNCGNVLAGLRGKDVRGAANGFREAKS